MFSFSARAAVRNQRTNTARLVVAVLLLFVSLLTTQAQVGGTDSIGTGGRNTIQGRIYFPSGRSADLRAKVRLETTNTGGLSVLADMDGVFRFTNLSGGSYTIVIEGGDEYETARESVYIEGNSSLGRGMRISVPPRNVTVPIYLQLKRLGKTSTRPGVINAALAGVPKAAADLYTAALEAARAGDSRKAVEHLRGAVSLYPEFAIALNELGVQYLRLHQADKAAEALQRAVKISPDALAPRLNYGIALLEKRSFVEAETELRVVLKRNDGAATAHLYLGITLINLRNYVEAEKELQRAASFAANELSIAYYYLGGIYWKNKEYKRAADALEKYLQQAPKAPEAERIRDTIKDLRTRQS